MPLLYCLAAAAADAAVAAAAAAAGCVANMGGACLVLVLRRVWCPRASSW